MVSCGNPAIEQDALMPRRTRTKQGFCVKCKGIKGKVVIRHAIYCKECFFSNFIQKSRKCLDPHINEVPNSRRTILVASGNLCVGFSGGLGSTVLLDWVNKTYPPTRAHDPEKGGKDHPRNVPIWPKAHVVYIECSSAFDNMKDKTEELRQVASSSGFFDFKALRLENAFDSEWWRSIGQDMRSSLLNVDMSSEELQLLPDSNTVQSPIARLRSYLSSLPTQTAVLSSIQTLIRLLLAYTADSLDCSHLLLGTSMTSLSINLISSISQGGGFVIREEAQEEWQRPNLRIAKAPLRILRPLRDVGMKECAMWAWWNDLAIVGKESLPGGRNGIGFLTKDFIVGLERDYPSTVSTIARTCGKLAPKESSSEQCSLCQRAAQSDVQGWKARISIRSLDKFNHQTPAQISHREAPTDQAVPRPSLTESLCYACHTTLTSKSSRGLHPKVPSSRALPLTPPIWVDNELWKDRTINREEQKAAVADFLL